MPTGNQIRPNSRNTPSAIGALLLLASIAATAAEAQGNPQEWLEQCRRGSGTRAQHCEVRETTLPATGSLRVDARPNGGIDVRSWDRNEIRVVARLQTHASTEAEARQIATQVHVDAVAGGVESRGPREMRDRGWSVSYDVFVPRNIDLTLSSTNGGIRVENVEGQTEVTTTNGGIAIHSAAGSVRGRTTNGGIDVRLQGTGWQGAGIDLRTTNGGITIHAPAGYSARVSARTTNGGISTDFPMTVQGRVGRSLEGEIGQGGAPLNIATTNGGIRLVRM
jgi:DUF4097 and DUF4098 domain-containing protein YvlB